MQRILYRSNDFPKSKIVKVIEKKRDSKVVIGGAIANSNTNSPSQLRRLNKTSYISKRKQSEDK